MNFRVLYSKGLNSIAMLEQAITVGTQPASHSVISLSVQESN